MLRQRILAIALGYEDGNDHQTLREDPLMQLVSERGIDPDQPLASPPTLCCLENRVMRVLWVTCWLPIFDPPISIPPSPGNSRR